MHAHYHCCFTKSFPDIFVTETETETDTDINITADNVMMATDKFHINDAWLNGNYGDGNTIYVCSLSKLLEGKTASDLKEHKGTE